MNELKKNKFSIGAYYFFFAASLGILMNIMPLYLSDQLGFSNTDIGIITGVNGLVSIVFSPLWGIINDTWKKPVRLLRILTIAVAGSAIFFIWTNAFIVILIVRIILDIFRVGIFPLIDVISVNFSHKHNLKHNRFRSFGSLGYSIILLLMTPFIEQFGLGFIFPVFILIFGVALLATTGLPKVVEQSPAIEWRKDIAAIMKNKQFILLISILTINLATTETLFSFQAIHLQDTLLAPLFIISLAVFIASGVSEVPSLQFVHVIYRKIGLEHSLVLGCILTLLRWLLLFFAHSYILYLVATLLHGIVFALSQPATLMMIRQTISAKLVGTAFSILVAIQGIFVFVLNTVVGQVIDLSGSTYSMFVIFFIFSLVATVLGLIFLKRYKGAFFYD